MADNVTNPVVPKTANGGGNPNDGVSSSPSIITNPIYLHTRVGETKEEPLAYRLQWYAKSL